MNNNGVQIRIGDLLYAIKKRWCMIALLTLAGFAMGAVMLTVSYAKGDLLGYQISCSVAVTSKISDGNYASDSHTPTKDDFYLAEDMPDAATYILTSDRVLQQALQQLGRTEITPKEVRNKFTVEQYNETQILELNLEWNSDTEGIALMKAILDGTQKILPQTLQMGTLEIIDEPAAKSSVGSSVASGMWFILGLLGFMTGIGIVVLDLMLRPTLINTEDIETVLETNMIGTIPMNKDYFHRGRLLLDHYNAGISAVEQSYASCAYIVRNLLGTKEHHHCFYVTSTESREGRTSAAANLAIQFSAMEKKVLLVDLDTRGPSLGGLFLKQVDYSHSLNALYKGEISSQEAIVSLSGYLDFLPMLLEHNAIALDGSLFDFLKKVGENYEYVILDAPPVGQISDTLSLNQLADSALFVVGYDQAFIPDIQNALRKLEKSGIRILGSIVNRVPMGNGREHNERTHDEEKRTEQIETMSVKNLDGIHFEGDEMQSPMFSLDKDPEESEGKELSDQEAMDALLQMGVDGNWKTSAQPENTNGSNAVATSQDVSEEGNTATTDPEDTEEQETKSQEPEKNEFDYATGEDQEDDFDI